MRQIGPPCHPDHLEIEKAKKMLREQRAMLENETLRRQVQELRNFLPLCEHSGMPYQEYFPAQRNNSLLSHGAASPDTVHNCVVDLQLGLSSEVSCKRKAPEKENYGSALVHGASLDLRNIYLHGNKMELDRYLVQW